MTKREEQASLKALIKFQAKIRKPVSKKAYTKFLKDLKQLNAK